MPKSTLMYYIIAFTSISAGLLVILLVATLCAAPEYVPEYEPRMTYEQIMPPEIGQVIKDHPGVVMVLSHPARGSGFIVDPSGLIITAKHVVDDNLSSESSFPLGIFVRRNWCPCTLHWI